MAVGPRSSTAPQPHVALDGVSFGYGNDAPVLDHVDLVVEPGDFVGIVGPSGCGKSTLLKILLGSLKTDHGTVQRTSGLRTAYVPQTEHINWDFPVTVAQCVLMSRVSERLLPWPSKAEKALVADALERLGIDELADRHIRALSGGQQQRVFLARAMLGSPDVLLLDEPTSGVDVKTRHEMLHLLGDLHAGGVSVVLTTHDLNGIATHLPRVVLLNGKVIGAGAPEDVLVPDLLEATYGSPMEVLEHSGMRVVIDAPSEASILPFRRDVS